MWLDQVDGISGFQIIALVEQIQKQNVHMKQYVTAVSSIFWKLEIEKDSETRSTYDGSNIDINAPRTLFEKKRYL